MEQLPKADNASFRIENIAPVLSVKDIPRSLAFYGGILGFRNAEWGDDSFTSVNRDSTGFYLCRGGQGNPGTWIWIGFDGDIFALCEDLKTKGATIRMPPTNFSWAYEFHVEDPDGHVLRFGTDPDPRQPFMDRQ